MGRVRVQAPSRCGAPTVRRPGRAAGEEATRDAQGLMEKSPEEQQATGSTREPLDRVRPLNDAKYKDDVITVLES